MLTRITDCYGDRCNRLSLTCHEYFALKTAMAEIGVQMRMISCDGPTDTCIVQMRNPQREWAKLYRNSSIERTAKDIDNVAESALRGEW